MFRVWLFSAPVPLRAYAHDKAQKLNHFFARTTAIEVIIAPHGRHAHDVELIAHVDGHDHFVAHCCDDDVYAAIDMSSPETLSGPPPEGGRLCW